MNEPDGVEIPPIENEVTGEITQVPIAAGSTAPNRMNVPIPNPSTDRPIDYCFSNMIYWLDDSISPEQRDVLDRLLRERGGRPVARRGDDHEAEDMGDGHTNGELGEQDVGIVDLVPPIDLPPDNDTDANADPANNDNYDPAERDQNPNPLLLNPSMARFDIDACTHIITRSWNILERRIIEQDPALRERLNNGTGNGTGTGNGQDGGGGGVGGGGGAGLWIVKVSYSHSSSAVVVVVVCADDQALYLSAFPNTCAYSPASTSGYRFDTYPQRPQPEWVTRSVIVGLQSSVPFFPLHSPGSRDAILESKFVSDS
jgi:hypothetical protein